MITLLHGAESYLVDREARALLERLRSGLTLEFNYEELDAETLGVEALADKLSTLPFIDATRVLVLRDLGLLSGKREKGGAAERAATLVSDIPESTHLVLVLRAAANPANPIMKVVAALERERRAQVQRFDPPRRADRAGWVRRLAEERGLTITPGAVRLLLQRVTPDLRLLDQEISKLQLAVMPSSRIDEKAVDALVGESREDEVWALSDALGSDRPGEVGAVLQDLLDSGREPTYLLYTLVSHWRRLLHARAIRDQGLGLDALQGQLKEHPFVVEKAYRQAGGFTAAELEAGFHDLLRIEEQIKLGELDGRLAIEGFVLQQMLQ
ncbi:MAG TPA: DNA polymerase III subunit delta [Candidatus Sulfotelmatobacter sp.]|nr:DNA polymerase III subunit delta [Candidatus Sulfotelmatobacter sp.]